MKNKIFNYKLHNKEILFKISEKGKVPLNIMIDQNQFIDLLGENFKKFLNSQEIICLSEIIRSQLPQIILREKDLKNSNIEWINVVILELFDANYNHSVLKEWIKLKRMDILKNYFMNEYRKMIKVEDFIKNENFSELYLLKKELKIQ